MSLDQPGGAWELERLESAPSEATRAPTITFDDARVSGFAGCNRFTGSVRREADAPGYFSGVAVTRMACPGPAMEIERRFLAALDATRAVRVVEGSLRFFGEGDEEIMRFRPVEGGAS